MNNININEDGGDVDVDDEIYMNVVAEMTHYGVGLTLHYLREQDELDYSDQKITKIQNEILVNIMENEQFYERLEKVTQKNIERFTPQ